MPDIYPLVRDPFPEIWKQQHILMFKPIYIVY